jgi:two-component system, chemotaxis family, CheB/CheR fusion protein
VKSEKTNVEARSELRPIIGIGASAGGLAALEEFVSGMAKDVSPQMACVPAHHLGPDHPSALTELVQRFTSVKVAEAINGASVEVNCCYIISPKFDLAVEKCHLRLTTYKAG